MSLENVTVRAAKGDIEEFKKSILWADIKKELISWKRGFEVELRSIVDASATSNPSTASVLMHLGDLNGRLKAVDYMLSLPDMFMQIIDSEKSKSSEQPLEEE